MTVLVFGLIAGVLEIQKSYSSAVFTIIVASQASISIVLT